MDEAHVSAIDDDQVANVVLTVHRHPAVVSPSVLAVSDKLLQGRCESGW